MDNCLNPMFTNSIKIQAFNIKHFMDLLTKWGRTPCIYLNWYGKWNIQGLSHKFKHNNEGFTEKCSMDISKIDIIHGMYRNHSRIMVIISKHFTHELRKICLFIEEKNPICDCLQSNQML